VGSIAKRRVVAAAVAVGVGVGTLGVAGCATKGTRYATPSSASATATSAAPAPTSAGGALPTGSMTPLPAASGQLTGTQLAAVLAPAADFPAGFAVSSSGAVTSGGTLTTGPAQYSLSTGGCSVLITHLGSTGFGETAMAANSVAGSGQSYDQAIYQFATAAEASAFVAAVSPLASRCPSFSAQVTNTSTATVHMTAAPGDSVAGHPTIELTQTASVSGTSLTLDTRLCASGVDVFVVSWVGLGKPAPTVPTQEAVIDTLMKRQAAAAVLGG